MYVCVCACMHVCVCMHACVCACMHVCVHACMCVCVCARVCVWVCVRACVCVSASESKRVHMNACVCFNRYVYISISVEMYIDTIISKNIQPNKISMSSNCEGFGKAVISMFVDIDIDISMYVPKKAFWCCTSTLVKTCGHQKHQRTELL